MNRIPSIFVLALALGLSSASVVQDTRMQNYDGSARAIESEIARYLGGGESMSIVTPGEFSEWPLNLKAGQIVLAEARSDAFDPALEIADATGKVVAANDDRYPGDQRPLLLWRCGQDGAYKLRARSFHNRSGGQVYVRFVASDCVDIPAGKVVERKFDKPCQFFLRVPMKAGQIMQTYSENPDPQRFETPRGVLTISPIGLPDSHLERRINPPIPNTIVAPVDGDYYVMESVGEAGKTVRVGAREIVPAKPPRDGGWCSASLPSASPLMAISVKAGELLEVSLPDVAAGAPLVVSEAPDFASYDLKKDEENPFYPRPKDKQADNGPAYTRLPGRARDSRIVVLHVKRDANLWLSTSGEGAKNGKFTMAVRPAARDFPEGKTSGSRLAIGRFDYWAFDAKAGDAMTLHSKAGSFALKMSLRGPEVDDMVFGEVSPDQTTVDLSSLITKDGRYWIAISAIGDGGGGEYSVSRQVFHPKPFGKGSPAKGVLASGQTAVWTLTVKPDEPLLVHWKASNVSYNVPLSAGGQASVGLPLTPVDNDNQYGVLKVDKPTTFQIILAPIGAKGSYFIEVTDIPGYVKGK